MHIDTVKLQFGDDGICVFCTRIHVKNLEAETPCRFVAVVIAERSELLKVELLHGTCILQVEDADGLAQVIHLGREFASHAAFVFT